MQSGLHFANVKGCELSQLAAFWLEALWTAFPPPPVPPETPLKRGLPPGNGAPRRTWRYFGIQAVSKGQI